MKRRRRRRREMKRRRRGRFRKRRFPEGKYWRGRWIRERGGGKEGGSLVFLLMLGSIKRDTRELGVNEDPLLNVDILHQALLHISRRR